MQPPDFVTLFIAPLNDLGIPYMVTGAVAAVIYAAPRFTRDLDVVMTLAPADADRIAAVQLIRRDRPALTGLGLPSFQPRALAVASRARRQAAILRDTATRTNAACAETNAPAGASA